MKFIYLANYRLPTELAHGLQVMQMCEALAAIGAQVVLLVPRRINKNKAEPFAYYGVEKKFKIIRIPCIDLLFLGGTKVTFFLQTLTFLISAKLFLLFYSHDVIYTREQLVGRFFKKFNLELHSLPHQISNWQKKIWRRADHLIVLTSFIKNRLVELGVTADRILVAPDGVNLVKFDLDLDLVSARQELGLPTGKKLIGYVGMLRTLGMTKGIDDAVAALANLPIDVILVLVGGYPEDIDYYKKLAGELGVTERIIFTGRVAHNLIPKYLKAMDILLAPFPETEHYKYYMSPLKIFEYMASDRPIITTDLPTIREILNDSNAKIIMPENNEELARAVAELLEDNNLANQLADQAKNDVQEYTWEKRAARIINFVK